MCDSLYVETEIIIRSCTQIQIVLFVNYYKGIFCFLPLHIAFDVFLLRSDVFLIRVVSG